MDELELFAKYRKNLKKNMLPSDYAYVEKSLELGRLMVWFSDAYILRCAEHPLVKLVPLPEWQGEYWTLETLQGTWNHLRARFSLKDERLRLERVGNSIGLSKLPIDTITVETPDCSVDIHRRIVTILI